MNKKVRKIFAVLFVLTLTLSLAACSGTGKTDSVAAVGTSSTAIESRIHFIWPLPAECRKVVAKFGRHEHPVTGSTSNHKGVDIVCPTNPTAGQPVYAVADGTVIDVYNECDHNDGRCNCNGGFGNCVKIDHGNGYVTIYAHLDEVKVSNDQTVTSGTTIGTIGKSGNAVDAHLHFAVQLDGEYVDPLEYYN